MMDVKLNLGQKARVLREREKMVESARVPTVILCFAIVSREKKTLKFLLPLVL